MVINTRADADGEAASGSSLRPRPRLTTREARGLAAQFAADLAVRYPGTRWQVSSRRERHPRAAPPPGSREERTREARVRAPSSRGDEP
jgi:hypothetical protein